MEGISAAVPVADDGDPLEELAEGGFVHVKWFWLNFCDAATLSNRLGVTVPAG